MADHFEVEFLKDGLQASFEELVSGFARGVVYSFVLRNLLLDFGFLNGCLLVHNEEISDTIFHGKDCEFCGCVWRASVLKPLKVNVVKSGFHECDFLGWENFHSLVGSFFHRVGLAYCLPEYSHLIAFPVKIDLQHSNSGVDLFLFVVDHASVMFFLNFSHDLAFHNISRVDKVV